MTTASTKAANFQGEQSALVAQDYQKAYDANIALNKPYIDAGTSAFGLKGTLSLDDSAMLDSYNAANTANTEQAINAGVLNSGNLTPMQEAALRAHLSRSIPSYGDYNQRFQQEMMRRRSERDSYNNNVGILQNLGLSALGASTGQDINLQKFGAQNSINSNDNMMQAYLMDENSKNKERSGLLGVAGTLGMAGLNYFSEPSSPQPFNYNNINPSDYGYWDNKFDAPTNVQDFQGLA